MNLFNIDTTKHLNSIIDAYSSVYGEEYHDIISSKIKKAIIIQFYDIDGYEDYLSYIKRCKRRELALIFFNKIGFNFENISITKPFDNDVAYLMDMFLGTDYTCFDPSLDKYFSPICAFNPQNNKNSEKILENKIKLINFLLRDKNLLITQDNYVFFTKTPEYYKVLKKINFYYHIYLSLLTQYQEFEAKLKSYEDFIDIEKNKLKENINLKKNELFNDIFPLINDDVKFILKELPILEQQNIILGNRELELKTPFEYFSKECMNSLYSNETSLDEKYWIIFFQSTYLKNLGIKFGDENSILVDNNDDVIKYLNLIESNEIKPYIPSEEIITIMQTLRLEKYQKAVFEYITNRSDFIFNYQHFIDNISNKNLLFHQILSDDICILENGSRNIKNDFVSIMFFTFKRNYGGKLMHCFIHELGHIIDQTECGCGFETNTFMCNSSDKNKYNPSHRKYEKFNEALTDIYTLEVLDILHKQGIYIIEDKNITCENTSSFNTSIYVKELLYPLLRDYRYYISKSKIYANPDYLIEVIGLKNYEDLVNIVNKVDSLVDCGLITKNDIELEQEYAIQLEKLNEVYANISNYHNSIKHILIK